MTIVLDTSVLVAFLHSGDARHDRARTIMRRVLQGEHGTPVSCDHVLDEGLTLLRKRPGREDVSRRFAAMFLGSDDLDPFIQIRSLSPEMTARAAGLHFERYERALSFTDCALATLAEDLDAPIASFDGGFDGVVPRIEE